MYNEVLVLPIAKEATIVGFTENLAVVVATMHPEDVDVYAAEAVRAVKTWRENAELVLVDEERRLLNTCR